GKLSEREPAEFDISYRHVELRAAKLGQDEWFTGAWFRFRPGDDKAARTRIKELLARRLATQPLELPNAGSVFRNPPGDHAARLIEALIALARDTVAKRFRIDLVPEVRIIGGAA